MVIEALLLFILIFPSICWGESYDEANPEFGGPPRALLEYDGAPGFWFRRDVALQMLADLQEIPFRQREVGLLEEELEIRLSQVERLREAANFERQSASDAREQLSVVLQQVDRLEGTLKAWWRSPVLWVGVGVVLAVALEVAAVAVILSVDP